MWFETILGLLVAVWGCSVTALVFAYRGELRRAWREPILRAPILIMESDDWGPGPDADGVLLTQLAAVLARHRDCRGRNPVVTIGVVLSVPDTDAYRRTALASRLTLSDPRFDRVREALLSGAHGRVLALQLHGLEHYWPGALTAAAGRDPRVARWLTGEGVPRTEHLPPPLQTRWANTCLLPSAPLGADEIREAVREEVAAFAEIFGAPPVVAVPPTFVWNDCVEREWAASGVRFVVTPGRRYVARDEAGRLIADKGHIYTGERSSSGVLYLVRDRYFEPSFGHDARHALAALAAKTRAGRPTLLEMHRFNFTGDDAVAATSLRELDRLLASALHAFPDVRFLSTHELGERLARRDVELIETRPLRRVAAWLVRLAETPRLARLAWFTGLAFPASIFLLIVRPAGSAPHPGLTGEGLAT